MIRPITNCLLILLVSLAPVVTSGSDSSSQHFNIVAKRFSFEPGEITVADHRKAVLELTSDDVTHGLKCKELDFNTVIHKGRTVELTFTPQHAGRFVARCSHFCGMGHGSMTLVITVVDE
ncbi:MAG: cupredoxin domain-containing protein [Candidatus Acidiferrales bacterium]